jgi:hypothetical protein
VIEPGFGHAGQVDGEELNDEQVATHPTCPTCKAVVLWPDTMIGFTVVLDDIVGHPKTFGETRIAYVTPKCIGPGSLWAKAAPLFVATPTVALSAHAVVGACSVIIPMGLMAFCMLQSSVLVARSEMRRGPCW